jgi:hypothetical protein
VYSTIIYESTANYSIYIDDVSPHMICSPSMICPPPSALDDIINPEFVYSQLTTKKE